VRRLARQSGCERRECSARRTAHHAPGADIAFAVIDQDNIQDPNDGYLNLAVEGLDVGEAILFIDGEFSGL
jgi:hypothetical protein